MLNIYTEFLNRRSEIRKEFVYWSNIREFLINYKKKKKKESFKTFFFQ